MSVSRLEILSIGCHCFISKSRNDRDDCSESVPILGSDLPRRFISSSVAAWSRSNSSSLKCLTALRRSLGKTCRSGGGWAAAAAAGGDDGGGEASRASGGEKRSGEVIGFAAHDMIMALGMRGRQRFNHSSKRLPSKCALLRFLHATRPYIIVRSRPDRPSSIVRPEPESTQTKAATSATVEETFLPVRKSSKKSKGGCHD